MAFKRFQEISINLPVDLSGYHFYGMPWGKKIVRFHTNSQYYVGIKFNHIPRQWLEEPHGEIKFILCYIEYILRSCMGIVY